MFEIKGVSANVTAAFSTRSAEIEAALSERGTSREEASAAEKQVAALDTRQAKGTTEHGSLVADWRETADRAGFDADARLALVREAETRAANGVHLPDPSIADRAVAHAADKLGERQSVFSVAVLHEEAGHLGLALEALNARLKDAPGDRKLREQRAALYEKLGWTEEAARERLRLGLHQHQKTVLDERF